MKPALAVLLLLAVGCAKERPSATMLPLPEAADLFPLRAFVIETDKVSRLVGGDTVEVARGGADTVVANRVSWGCGPYGRWWGVYRDGSLINSYDDGLVRRIIAYPDSVIYDRDAAYEAQRRAAAEAQTRRRDEVRRVMKEWEAR